jgi:signal transduction histidine kinase
MEAAVSLGPPLSEELAAGLAHEIRNQLNSLQCHLGVLQRDLSDLPADATPRITLQLTGIARALGAIEDFLADFLLYARPQALHVEPADARALVQELVAFLAPEAAARGITLTANVADAPEQAALDTAQMKRALLNLVLNGIQATPNGGSVELTCGSVTESWTLSIRDSGPGLPPHVRERLFSPFVSGGSGAGLGLAIAQQIVAAHGGQIEVHSAARRGTELQLTLPRRLPRHV